MTRTSSKTTKPRRRSPAKSVHRVLLQIDLTGKDADQACSVIDDLLDAQDAPLQNAIRDYANDHGLKLRVTSVVIISHETPKT